MSAYDAIADWYEHEFPARDGDPLGIDHALRTLLGAGPGTCLEIGCGGFADRTGPAAIVIGPGYRCPHTTTTSWTSAGLRDKVGATHWPLPELLASFHRAGLPPVAYAEGGSPTPTVFAVGAGKAAGPARVLR